MLAFQFSVSAIDVIAGFKKVKKSRGILSVGQSICCKNPWSSCLLLSYSFVTQTVCL